MFEDARSSGASATRCDDSFSRVARSSFDSSFMEESTSKAFDNASGWFSVSDALAHERPLAESFT